MSTNLIAASKESVWYVIDASLYCFDFNRRSVEVDTSFSDLGGLTIRCLVSVDGYQKPWCGTTNGIYFLKGEQWTKLSAIGDFSPGTTFSCLAFDGKCVLAAANRGLALLSIGEYFSWEILYNTTYGLPNNRVNCLVIDQEQHLLCGTSQGLATKDHERFSNFVADALTTANILDLAISPTGQVWFVEETSLRKRKKDGTWETDTGWSHGLPEAMLQCLHIDAEGIIYVGTNQGVVACKNGIWKCIDGTVSENIRCLYSDGQGTVWCLTTKALLCLENLKALNLNEILDFGLLLKEREVRRQSEMPIISPDTALDVDGRAPTIFFKDRDDTVLLAEQDLQINAPQPSETPRLKSPQAEKLTASVILTIEHAKAKATNRSPAIFRVAIARTNFPSDVQWTLEGLPERAAYGCSTNYNKLTISVDASQVNISKLPKQMIPLQLIGKAPGVTIAPIELELRIEKSLPYWVLPTLGFVSVYAVIIIATASAPVKLLEPAWTADDSMQHAAEGGINLRVMVPEEAKLGEGKLEIYRGDASSQAASFVDAIFDSEHAGLFVYKKRLPEGKYRLLVTLPGYRPLEKVIVKESAMVTKADSDTGIGAPPLTLERKFLKLF
ncbi:MAG: hypothetical protein H7Y37_06440 [Anaerolineae bacterium]|nr:hypothetical protein [Gloeobacterales cyanobacterium ES-bin-313]